VRAPRWLLLAAVVLGLAACTGEPGLAPGAQSPTGPPVTSNAPSATASTTPTSPPTPITGTSPITEALGTVTITKSGGLAGVQQILTVKADGSWTFIDKRKTSSITGRLTAAERQRVAALLSDPALQEEVRQPPVVCNDGFRYTVQSADVSMRFDQCNLGPKMRDLLAALSPTPIN
jgi:hypothetical protein